MTTPEEVWAELESGRLSPRAAVERLEALGYGPALARESVFITLGGDDVIETGDDGIDRYQRSGKAVREIEQMMADINPSPENESAGDRTRADVLKNGFILDDSPLDRVLYRDTDSDQR